MNLEKLISQFIETKNRQPENADELLDFLQRSYLTGQVTLSQYQSLFRVLQDRGAKKPDYFNDETKTETMKA
ncbi:YppF family protein [Pseudalkalibacillus caeni]|uniref:YppF family protein n=1 Tax=Exobacillus caeni TaxID=2574798 RepID=UPI001485417F|nr:YppF family protein [Pseudalkalibacillus caeni]